MSLKPQTLDLLCHLASRPGYDEVKADFRQLLVDEFGIALNELEFERRVPEVKGRLDALIGRTIFEAKQNLDQEWGDIERRMPDYLADREKAEGRRFVGIASDGLKWVIFERREDKLEKVKGRSLDPENGEQFLAWLDGTMALRTEIPPDPLNVRVQLGQDSEAYRHARDMMAAAWGKLSGRPAVVLKRQLWSQLLKLVYGREIESDELFFQHTFLVVVAKAIALAVLDLPEDEPGRVLSGAAFEVAGVFGAAESDFFDWIVADTDGQNLVRRIVTHVRRFRLDKVESDVLKILYESLIDREERHGLGEYYTPDWLAAKIVRHVVERPIEQRVLDPACGSGTFLFHAVRNFLADAEDAGLDPKLRAEEATAHIAGLDIHPVAVIIARVTYLLALQPVIAKRGGPLSIPVYLGDALQLSTQSWMDGKELVINVPDPPGHKHADNGMIGERRTELKFPEVFCKDIPLFDKLVAKMREGSEQKLSAKQIAPVFRLEIERHYKRDIRKDELDGVSELVTTYGVYDGLVREGRDSVWSYVARNLSRPLALAFGAGWANVVVGNPPWVAFRHMSADLQKRFRALARGERVHVGGKFGTQNDLSALFVVRAAALYLRSGGRLAFVLPFAALTRGQFENLRGGSFFSAKIAWDEAWTMDDSVRPLFPVPSCVVFGRRRAIAKAIPEKVTVYTGSLPFRDAPEEIADRYLTVEKGAPKPAEGIFTGGSAYRAVFRNGATLYPRVLCLIERLTQRKLGSDPTAPFVATLRSKHAPWNAVSRIEGRVEAEFIYSILLGESIVPYRVFRSFEGVVPATRKGDILDARAAANRGAARLHAWMTAAEAAWNEFGTSREALSGQFNHNGKLASQFSVPDLRVVYSKSGALPTACVVRESFVIDHKLYWSSFAKEEEARYLEAILNSETARARVAALQSRGQWGARDFDKVMFTLPIPRFDEMSKLHRDLASAAAQAEEVAGKIVFPEGMKFQRARKLVRDALAAAGVSQRIDALVAKLLDTKPKA